MVYYGPKQEIDSNARTTGLTQRQRALYHYYLVTSDAVPDFPIAGENRKKAIRDMGIKYGGEKAGNNFYNQYTKIHNKGKRLSNTKDIKEAMNRLAKNTKAFELAHKDFKEAERNNPLT